MDKNKHKLYMAQMLSLIFKDKDLCNVIAFKGGTSLMFSTISTVSQPIWISICLMLRNLTLCTIRLERY